MKRGGLLVGALAIAGLLVGAAGNAHPPWATLAPLVPLFRTADRCLACHTAVTAPSGKDVSIGYDWRASMMANSARDPYWQASVRREAMDHAGERASIEDECSKCHMPMARATAAAEGRLGRVFDHLPVGGVDGDEAALAADGVSCALCHQILPDGLGEETSFSGSFRVDPVPALGERDVFGPFEVDSGRVRVMHSATGFRPTEASHLRESSLCATCHTLTTHALGAGAGGRLPEQMPYQEWRASAFAEERSCQSCHMPRIGEDVAITSVLGQLRSGTGRHVFQGGNFFMLRMLNRYRAELGVTALPQEMEAAANRSVAHLQSETARVEVARMEIEDGRLIADVVVTNLAGHKFPTAYPSRRAWLQVTVRDSAGAVVFESGAFARDGSVTGNDHDIDPLTWESHHAVIERPDQVQVYESVMSDPQGRPTTGLLTAVRYLKDNRLLPRGFERAAGRDDVAVVGEAVEDPDFVGGSDRVRYAVDIEGRSGPYRLDVALWFQPIGFRWARTLAEYDAAETRRFVAWYDAMAAGSALVVARAEGRVP